MVSPKNGSMVSQIDLERRVVVAPDDGARELRRPAPCSAVT